MSYVPGMPLVILLASAMATDIVMLGNSYMFQHHLDLALRETLRAGLGDKGETVLLADAGYSFRTHADSVATVGTAWYDALGADERWDWAILQDQSQIPGFPQTDPTWIDSNAAGRSLNEAVVARGGRTVLMMTWGRRDGDAQNPSLYPDFLTMQARLKEGYLAYQAAWSTPEHPVWIAPVGLAFEAAYHSGTDFTDLYEADGSHPSVAGTWLASCVLYATLTGEDPTALPGPADLDAALAARLAELARATVLEGGLEYPWSSEEVPEDSTPGTDDDDDPSPEDGDSAEDAGSPKATPAAGPAACGCASGPQGLGSWAWSLLLLPLSLRRRAADLR